MNATQEIPQQINSISEQCLVSSGRSGVNGARTGSKSDAPLTPSGSGFDLPTVRKLLATRNDSVVTVLRKQISNYERGDAESRAALKPMILASVGKIETRSPRP